MYRIISDEEIKIDTALGYLYFLDNKHPLATGNSYRVYLHRHLKSLELGYWLGTDTIVHHKDGDTFNNDLTNLEIMSQSEHMSRHMRILPDKQCKACGISYRPLRSTQKYCSVPCSNSRYVPVTSEITIEDIVYWVTNYSWTRASRELGLSDNGLRKKYKALTGIDPKTPKTLKKSSQPILG